MIHSYVISDGKADETEIRLLGAWSQILIIPLKNRELDENQKSMIDEIKTSIEGIDSKVRVRVEFFYRDDGLPSLA